MSEKESQEIVTDINTFLAKILSLIFPNNNYNDCDTATLIAEYTDHFNDIKNAMNWDNNEQLSRAFLIKNAHNRYFHITKNSVIDEMIELDDILNILLFFKSMESLLSNDITYLIFKKDLELKALTLGKVLVKYLRRKTKLPKNQNNKEEENMPRKRGGPIKRIK
jgi:hypothetical protein